MNLQQLLEKESPAALAQEARKQGDAARGALVFHQPFLACRMCHKSQDGKQPLGPDLTKWDKPAQDAYLVEALLHPSKAVRKGYESISVLTTDGSSLTGLLVKNDDDGVSLRDVSLKGKVTVIPKAKIDQVAANAQSVMPEGQVSLLRSRREFLDLVRYLMEIAEKGPRRELELRPPPSLYAARPLPEYEKSIDHAGMIRSLDKKSYQRGEEIYLRLCVNCHGTKDRPGSLPTSLKFASGKFKNGSDPHSMYRTLTHGFGMMTPQAWMVPEQKYDVIHYVREEYLKKHNPSQFVDAAPEYLSGLPKGDTRGPKPSNVKPWSAMDYGPYLMASYEVGSNGTNFAYKGIAVRLDSGPGGVTRGRYWMVYDHDTLRVAAAWNGQGFIDYNAIMMNGRHGAHPRLVGDVQLANPSGPGWGTPGEGSFEEVRVIGRDKRRYGPLPRDWAQYKGLYRYGDRVVLSYTVGESKILETPGVEFPKAQTVFTRTFNIGSRDKDLILQVARESGGARLKVLDGTKAGTSVAVFGTDVQEAERPTETTQTAETAKSTAKPVSLSFNGATRVEASKPNDFETFDKDYTIFAQVKTSQGGTIFSKTVREGIWAKDCTALFV
ncbi:MAG: c-type cytochrome, partial [Planctomycetales bacterium]